jgi:hypothetical protein
MHGSHFYTFNEIANNAIAQITVGKIVGNKQKRVRGPIIYLTNWWSRRESNPRPQTRYNKFYILSLII